MKGILTALALVAALAGCGGGPSGPAKDVQDGLNYWLEANAEPPEDVGKASGCEEVGILRFRCTIDFPGSGGVSDPYEQTYSCDPDGLCTNGSIYFRADVSG